MPGHQELSLADCIERTSTNNMSAMSWWRMLASHQDRVSMRRGRVGNRVSALPLSIARSLREYHFATDLLQLIQQLGGELEALHQAEGLSRELLEAQLERTGFSDQVVQEVMTHTAITVNPESTLVVAAAAMIQNHVHRLAVTDAKGTLLGIVSTTDIIRALAESSD
jgi:hypothetical protein